MMADPTPPYVNMHIVMCFKSHAVMKLGFSDI